MGPSVDFLDLGIYGPVDRIEDRSKNSNQLPIHRPNTGSSGQRLRRCWHATGLLEVCHNSQCQVRQPLPLSQAVRP
jgi:hypothetical protein